MTTPTLTINRERLGLLAAVQAGRVYLTAGSGYMMLKMPDGLQDAGYVTDGLQLTAAGEQELAAAVPAGAPVTITYTAPRPAGVAA